MKSHKIFCRLLVIFSLVCIPLATEAMGTAGLPKNLPFDKHVKEIAKRHGIEPSLVHSIILHESNYNIYAVSSKGALGLMQLMPETAEQYGVLNVFDPVQNIEGGVRYLKDLTKLYAKEKTRDRLIVAAYNAGQQAVKKYNGIPPYPETRSYISHVMATYALLPKTRKIISFIDSDGKVRVTNDIRYASLKGAGKD
jgi:soluble lytic murein transglycosylase-like protein